MLKRLVFVLSLMMVNSSAYAGPLLATVCSAGCSMIMECGCIAVGFIMAPVMSPPAAAMIAASCGVLQSTGSIPACIAMCLALPTP